MKLELIKVTHPDEGVHYEIEIDGKPNPVSCDENIKIKTLEEAEKRFSFFKKEFPVSREVVKSEYINYNHNRF